MNVISQTDENYDLIVVGGGLGALAAGAIQARRGKRVLVVEKHKVLGGYASVFARKGITFDVSLHQIGGVMKTRVRKILENAGVYDRLEFIKSASLSDLQLEPGGKILRIPNGDMEAFKRQLIGMFPNEKFAIRLWFWTMRRFGRQLGYFDNVRSGPFRQGAVLFLAPVLAPFLVFSSLWMPVLSLTLRARDPKLRKILLHFSGYYGLPADEINMLYPMVANYSYHHDGGYYLKGGGFSISRNLAVVIRKNGGTIITGKAVSKIETEENKVTGIRLADSEKVYKSSEIVCGANPFAVYGTMLDNHPVARSELAKIRKMEVGMTASVLYIQLDVPAVELNPDLAGVYEFVIPPEEDEKTYYNRFRNRTGFDEGYERDGINLTIHSNADPHNDAPGSTLDIFFCDNYQRWARLGDNAYQEQKVVEIKKMLEAAEKVLPGIEKHISVLELGTPVTMKKFTGNEKGALYGFAQTPAQAATKRFKIKSPLRGLKFVSAWSNPGGGYEGVLRAADAHANPITWKGIAVLLSMIVIANLIGPVLGMMF